MTCLQDSNTKFALAAEIKRELNRLECIAQRLEGNQNHSNKRYALELSSAQLQNFYKCCERILRLLTWELRGGKARGINWRQRLLQEATQQIDGIRPPIISGGTREALHKLLALRNQIRNIYGYQPHPQSLKTLTHSILALYPRVAQEIEHYKKLQMQKCRCPHKPV